MGQKIVGEFPLGHGLERLAGGDGSAAGAVAGAKGLLAYMFLRKPSEKPSKTLIRI
jgi:hypothetical protein